MSMNDPLALYTAAAREAEVKRRLVNVDRLGVRQPVHSRRRSMAPARRAEVLADIATGARPWPATRRLWRTFADLDDLLLNAQKTWLAALSEELAHLDRDDPHGPADGALRAYVATRARLPGLAALLAEHEGHPALEIGVQWEYRTFARAAGVADATVLLAQARAAADSAGPAPSSVQPATSSSGSVRVPSQRRPVLERMAGVLQRTAH
jgi:hypothetical protein